MRRRGHAFIGISGWRYPPWRGVFYPPGLPQKRELGYASEALRTIEINGSFYSLQRPSSWLKWHDAVAEDFVFAVKGGRFITHNKKLRDCRPALANFFASGVLALRQKLGPILWQLPPQLAFDEARLEDFFAELPQTTLAAAKLGSEHDARLKHGAWLDVEEERPLRYALEVRHPSFDDPRFLRVLERHKVALCVADTAGKWPYLEHATTKVVYVRLHGARRLYASGYTRGELDTWAEKIETWLTEGRDVYVYFDNDVRVRAPYDAINLAARLGIGEAVPFPRKRLRAVDAVRGVEVPRTSWNDWRGMGGRRRASGAA